MKEKMPPPASNMDCESTALACRNLVYGTMSGALATLEAGSKAPYVSLCAHGCDFLANPIFLLSDLADHTKNIAEEDRVSFLCEQASHLANPQAGPRVTLMGRMVKIDETRDCTLFLHKHPSAKNYADFTDFNFYKLQVEKAHYVGGFGRAIWLAGSDYVGDSAASLNFSNVQQEFLGELNDHFPEFARICATKLLKLQGENWHLLRVDGDGMDLSGPRGFVRYPFEKRLKTTGELLDFARNLHK